MKQRLIVLKIGGKVVDDIAAVSELLKDFSLIPGKKILVHGGGKSATLLAEKLGIEATMIEGRRITDAAMLEVAVMVYAGLVNKRLVSLLQSNHVNAIGLCGADLDVIRAHKRPVKTIDYGFAGDIDEVNSEEIGRLLENRIVPVMAPITHDGAGQLLNTNADTIASTVARAMSSLYKVELVYCFEKAGVLRDPEDENTLISEIDPNSYIHYKEEEIVSGGMLPKLDNAFAALEKGVFKVRICNRHAIANLGSGEAGGTVLHL